MASAPALTEVQREHFIAHGWVKVPKAFTQEQANTVIKDVWTRLDMSPTDKSTWTRQQIHMPSHTSFDCAQFAPRAWAAICELCGGEERVTSGSRQWRDSLIVNLGSAQGANKPVRPQDLWDWHVDGDFFMHFLDSPEQGLLVIPLFTDIAPGGGGTVICPEAMPHLAQWLYEHPDGVMPSMAPRDQPDYFQGKVSWYKQQASRCSNFVEATGECGDVYLLHPLMLHSASTNPLRNVRIITNPPVSLKEPFCFDRDEGARKRYSPVELATLRALGKDRLAGWKITAPRDRIVPERIKKQERMKQEELKRLGRSKPVPA